MCFPMFTITRWMERHYPDQYLFPSQVPFFCYFHRRDTTLEPLALTVRQGKASAGSLLSEWTDPFHVLYSSRGATVHLFIRSFFTKTLIVRTDLSRNQRRPEIVPSFRPSSCFSPSPQDIEDLQLDVRERMLQAPCSCGTAGVLCLSYFSGKNWNSPLWQREHLSISPQLR